MDFNLHCEEERVLVDIQEALLKGKEEEVGRLLEG